MTEQVACKVDDAVIEDRALMVRRYRSERKAPASLGAKG
jgi:hypothetical protein